MKLIVHELDAVEVAQVLTPEKNTIVEAVRPHIYRHNFPSGSLKMQIYDESDVLVAQSELVDIADIGTQAFFHGYVRFLIDAYLTEGEPYKFKLVGAGGYSFSEPAYCGWCNGFDLVKYDIDGTPLSPLHYPLDLEIWERKVR